MVRVPQLDRTAAWKRRFRTPVVLHTQIAATAPTRGLAVTNHSGVYQLHAWDVPSGALQQLTTVAQGVLQGLLSPDGRYVYYHDDAHGDEIGHYVRVPFEDGTPTDVTPDLPPYASFSMAISLSGASLGFVMAIEDGFHLYIVDLGSDGGLSVPRRLYHSTRFTAGPLLSYRGDVALLASTERSGSLRFSLLAIDVATGAVIGELWDGPESSVQPSLFSRVPGDLRVLAKSDRTGDERPLIWNPRTGERTDLALDQLSGEVTAWDWSPDGARILLCNTSQAIQRLYLYDVEAGTLVPLEHPGGSFGGAYFTPSGEIIAHWEDATHAPQAIALDGGTGAQRRVALHSGTPPPGRPWRSVTFPTSGDQNIQAWLAVPEGEGPFPVILHTHGGPQGVTTEGFSPSAQAWLDHGFAFLTINYRGSTTFGREFEQCIWGNLGHLEVDDMVAAREWLINQGIAHPDQILLTGWSYGGYLTLQALGTRPGLWAGGMAGIAIADWAIQYEDTADTLRGYQVAILGGTPTEKPEVYAASSPITYVDRVDAPVLIIQGRNDTRTPARPVEMYEARMKALGKPIEVMWFETGHLGSFAQVELGIEHTATMLRFAHEVLSHVAPVS